MKQIRWITHNDNHVDEETLINGIWAVTRCDCELVTKENNMSRTLNLNLTGKAAQGHDDIMDIPSDHARRLKIASDKVKAIINDDASYLSLMLKIKDGEMLETFETIISQCKEWDEMEQAKQADEAQKIINWLSDSHIVRRVNPATNGTCRPQPAQLPITPFSMTACDEDGCRNDADLYDFARGG